MSYNEIKWDKTTEGLSCSSQGNPPLNNLLSERIKAIDPRKIIFWVGAGIDSNPPTSLPRADELTKALLNRTCGECTATRILDIYNKTNLPSLRLETIIQEIQIFEGQWDPSFLKKQGSILQGFKSFLEAPANACHSVLAQYLKCGSNIVTTNYGNSIPISFKEQFYESMNCKWNESLKMYVYSGSDKCFGQIYHIHGVADDLQSMGLSLRSVKNPLSNNFKHLVKEWIKSDFTFIFLGYSCSDTLDVNVMFQEIKEELSQPNGTGIMINHSTEYKEPVSRPLSQHTQAIFNVFKNKYQYDVVTTRFMYGIAHRNTHITNKGATFQWEKSFDTHSKRYSPALGLCVSLGYTRLLGLNASQVLGKKWENFETDSVVFRKNSFYSPYHRFINSGKSINPLKRILIQTQYRRTEDTRLSKSNVASQNFWFKKAAQVKTFEELEASLSNCIANQKQIDWNISTILNRKMQWMIFNASLPLVGRINRRRKVAMAYKIVRLNEQILNQHRNSIYDYIQILVALCGNGLLKMVFCEKDYNAHEEIEKACNYYKDVSCCSGTCKCHLFLALAYLLRLRFFGKNYDHRTAGEYLKESLNNIKKAKEILQVIKTRNEKLLYIFSSINYMLYSVILCLRCKLY